MKDSHKKKLMELILKWFGPLKADGKAESGRTNDQFAKLVGIGSTYVSIIRNGNYSTGNPADNVWEAIDLFFQEKITIENLHIESPNYIRCVDIFDDCKNFKKRGGIDGYSGAGKTYACLRYAKNNENVYVVRGRSSMGPKQMLLNLATQIKVEKAAKLTLYDLEDAICNKLAAKTKPSLVIFDELEFMKPACIASIKSLCDLLEGTCGVVLSGIIKEHLKILADKEKRGMPQTNRRFEMKWQSMLPVGFDAGEIPYTLKKIGVTDVEIIHYIKAHAKNYDVLATMMRDCLVGLGKNELSIEYLQEIYQDKFDNTDATEKQTTTKKTKKLNGTGK